MGPSAGRALLRGQEGRIFDILSQHATPEIWATWLEFPLELASARGDTRLARKLAAAGGKIGISLHEAVRNGHDRTVRALLDCGVCSRTKDGDGDAPLHVAAAGGHAGIARLLLREGADKDALDIRGRAPLHVAAISGSLAVVELLLTAGADLGIRYVDDDDPHLSISPLDQAAGRGKLDVMMAMIKHGGAGVVSAISPAGRTALHHAGNSGGGSAVDILIKAGADVDAVTWTGHTPLHFASSWSNLDSTLALLKHGAGVNLRTAGQGQTPLHLAGYYMGPVGTSETVAALLRWGADETIENYDGHKPEDVLGAGAEGNEDHVEEEMERVQKLLLHAPADRAWRRRGYLVLCRAHPDRGQLATMMMMMMGHHDDERRNPNDADVVSGGGGGCAIRKAASPPRTRSRAKRAAVEAASATRIISAGLELNSSSGGIGSDGGDGAGAGAGAMNTMQDGGRSGREWPIVAGWVLGVKEEGLFRSIVGYL